MMSPRSCYGHERTRRFLFLGGVASQPVQPVFSFPSTVPKAFLLSAFCWARAGCPIRSSRLPRIVGAARRPHLARVWRDGGQGGVRIPYYGPDAAV